MRLGLWLGLGLGLGLLVAEEHVHDEAEALDLDVHLGRRVLAVLVPARVLEGVRARCHRRAHADEALYKSKHAGRNQTTVAKGQHPAFKDADAVN